MTGSRSRRSAAVTLALAALIEARRRASSGGHGRLGRRLAAWEPRAPATPGGRLAGYVWAAPITCAGLLAGSTSGTRPRLREGVVLFAPARGATGAVLRRRGYSACALGHVVLSLAEPSPQLLAHELVHVRQAERLGPVLAPVYLGLLAVHGYRRNPLEVAAYRVGAAGSA